MYLMLTGWALLVVALLLPSGRQIPLAVRYQRLEGGASPSPVRRRLLARLPTDRLVPLLPRRYTETLRSALLAARMTETWPLPDFLAVKLIVSVLLILLMLLYWLKTSSAVFALAIPLQAAAGWSLPDFVVKRRAAVRREAAERELPHMLSGLAICLQTGLSLQSALIQLAVLRPVGVLGEELNVVATHLNAGATPPEALAAMIERCRTPDLARALGNVLQHAEKGPRAAGAAAAAESHLAWQRRRRRAEAIAHTASLKLYLPQLLLGLPSLFLVLMGPAVLQIWQMFHSM